MINESSFL